MGWQRRTATVIALLTGAVIVIGCAVLAVAPDNGLIIYFTIAVIIGLASTVLGLVVASRRPGNPVGALLTGVGLVPCVITMLDVVGMTGVRQPGAVPGSEIVVSLSQGAWMWWFVSVGLLALHFPDGRLPGTRWRGVATALPAVAIVFGLLEAMTPTPYPAPYQEVPHVLGAVPSVVDPLTSTLPLLLLGLLVAVAVSIVRRYRDADDVGRAQLKWFALASLFLPVTLLSCWTSYLLFDGPDVVLVGLALTYLMVPAGTTIAMLRHDLYDVDRTLSTAVAYGLATTCLLAVFAGTSFLSGAVLGSESVMVAAGTTAACAVTLAPLRIRLQRQVDQRLYPVRRAALAALDDLRQCIHNGQARPEQLEDVLGTALRDRSLRVGYLLPGGTEFVDAAGNPLRTTADQLIPVRLADEQIGILMWNHGGSRQLLRELASASALLVEMVRLRIELAQALHEVQASRGRLLQIGYQERRRLERDLHDGAQQRLVALGMSLRLAQRHLGDGTVNVDRLLDQSVTELRTAVTELRQIAHGLRPSSLDDGLGPALAALTSTMPVPVELDVATANLPDDIATTAYYVASEAITNAAKHARADQIGLQVTHEHHRLRIAVIDDGVGGATAHPDSGLAGLADRVAAAGGSLRVHSPTGLGTVVEAVLPCG